MGAGKVAEAIERWRTGIAFLLLLSVLGGASFLVMAITMMGAAALLDAAYLASAAILCFPGC